MPWVTPHPWREVAWALVAVVLVLVIGWFWGAGWLLPKPYDVINQVIISSPLVALLAIRRQPLSSAWLRTNRIWLRLVVGLGLAMVAILVCISVRGAGPSWLTAVSQVYTLSHAAYAVQVLGEDFGMAILFVRLSAAVGSRLAILSVAVLFSLAHVSGLLQNGATAAGLGHLVLDAGLAVVVLAVVQTSADIWWFWMVHFAMDMMQFTAPHQ
jgi:hypothetical protein